MFTGRTSGVSRPEAMIRSERALPLLGRGRQTPTTAVPVSFLERNDPCRSTGKPLPVLLRPCLPDPETRSLSVPGALGAPGRGRRSRTNRNAPIRSIPTPTRGTTWSSRATRPPPSGFPVVGNTSVSVRIRDERLACSSGRRAPCGELVSRVRVGESMVGPLRVPCTRPGHGAGCVSSTEVIDAGDPVVEERTPLPSPGESSLLRTTCHPRGGGSGRLGRPVPLPGVSCPRRAVALANTMGPIVSVGRPKASNKC